MQETLVNPDSINRLIEALVEIGKQLAIIAGAIGMVGSFVAARGPKHWAITQLCARYFADTRNIRKVPVPNNPAETLRHTYTREDELTPVEPSIARRKSDPPPPDTLR